MEVSCIQETLKYGEHEMPGINVGHISEKNDAYENDDWPPLYGQESASYEFCGGCGLQRGHRLAFGRRCGLAQTQSLAISDERYARKERTTKPSKTIRIRRMESSTKLTSPLCTTRGFLATGPRITPTRVNHATSIGMERPSPNR